MKNSVLVTVVGVIVMSMAAMVTALFVFQPSAAAPIDLTVATSDAEAGWWTIRITSPPEPDPVSDDIAEAEDDEIDIDDPPLIEPCSVITVPGDVLFGSGEAELLPASLAALVGLPELVEETGLALLIEGHTDSDGDPSFNHDLGLRRALAVADYLRSAGATIDVDTDSAGETDPVADNDTPEGRAANRRVELHFSCITN